MTKNHDSKSTSTNPMDDIAPKEECFIITPIGAGGSDVYIKAMGLIDAVIQPVLDEYNLQSRPANRMQDLGSINKQLITRILEDKLVIANLTGLNPNVMYELAVRHAARKPVIIMAEQGTRLPFDLTDQRTIFYSDSLSGVEIAKDELREKISFALKDENPDNPIYAVLEKESIFKKLSDDDPLKLIMEKIEELGKSNQSKSSISNEPRVYAGQIIRRHRLVKGQLSIKNPKNDDSIKEQQQKIMHEMITEYSKFFNKEDFKILNWNLEGASGNFTIETSFRASNFINSFCSDLSKNKFVEHVEVSL